MENGEDMKTNVWIDDRLAALAPNEDWRPSVEDARRQLNARSARQTKRFRAWTWATATALLAVTGLLSFPSTRAVAQRLWERRILGRVEVAQVDLDALPVRWSLTGGFGDPVRDVAEAEQRAGFHPNLPPSGILTAHGRLSVIEPETAQITISTEALSNALRDAGGSELTVPRNWEGPALGFQIGPVVEADYGDAVLRQCQPILLVTPPDFSIRQFAEIAFRIGGMSPAQARGLSESFAENPSWLIGVPRNGAETVQPIALRAGTGMLIEDASEHGQERQVSLLWNTSNRYYQLSGKIPRELAITVANSLQ